MANSFSTAFQVYIPGFLGEINNVSVHGLGDTKTIWCHTYISFRGFEWSKVYCDSDGQEVTYYDCLEEVESYSISFPVEIWDFIEGSFYLSFMANKDGNSIFYHTEKHYFRKADKLICVRESHKMGF